jgi:hypothetical protein
VPPTRVPSAVVSPSKIGWRRDTSGLRHAPWIEALDMIELDTYSLTCVSGGASCLPQAKREAVNFSARENGVSPRSIKVTGSHSFGLEAGRRYYGVALDNGEHINVGLTPRACRLREINYVTDGA